MKISVEAGRPSGEWVSWNEPCGIGDGTNTSFPLPFPAKEARGLVVTRDLVAIEPDATFPVVETNEDGKRITVQKPDGWKLDGDFIVFDRAPRFGARVAVSCIGRQVGDAFKIYGQDSTISKKLDELMPPELKNRRPNDVAKLPAIQTMCRVAFMELVSDWAGIMDQDGNPVPCDDAGKKRFLDLTDVVTFGLFVMDRSRAIQRERVAGFEKSVED